MRISFILLIICLAIGMVNKANAACSSQISRTNFTANSVLTSTELNSQFNTAYNHVNDLDGDCITSGTLNATALDTSTSSPLTDTAHQGCILSLSDSNTISVSKCKLAIKGSYVDKSTATTVTWLCSGCSAEAASTFYYVYADETSTGSSLVLIISTTAPDDNGYNGNDKVLGKFYNDASSDIQAKTIVSWEGNRLGFERAYVYYNSNSGASVTGGNPILYEDLQEDAYNFYNTSTGVATVPTGLGGLYRINGSARLGSSASSLSLEIHINGTARKLELGGVGASTTWGADANGTFRLAAGDTIEIVTSSTYTLSSTATYNVLTIERVGE